MELWEGAILVVGGIFLVGYMSRRNQQVQHMQANANATATTITSAGTSNASNLTTITNQAGGFPTYAGESLEPPGPPIVSSPYIPVRGTATPISQPVSMRMPLKTMPVSSKPVIPARPIDVHLPPRYMAL